MVNTGRWYLYTKYSPQPLLIPDCRITTDIIHHYVMLYYCFIQKQAMYDNETFQSQSFTNYKSKYSEGAAQHFQEQFSNFILKRTSLGIFCTICPIHYKRNSTIDVRKENTLTE